MLKKKLMFQNIERTQRHFKKLGIDPYEVLGEAGVDFVRLNIEKRHGIGHNLSLADEDFTNHDDQEKEGQTVRLLADDILRFAESARKVVAYVEGLCPEFGPGAARGLK